MPGIESLAMERGSKKKTKCVILSSWECKHTWWFSLFVLEICLPCLPWNHWLINSSFLPVMNYHMIVLRCRWSLSMICLLCNLSFLLRLNSPLGFPTFSSFCRTVKLNYFCSLQRSLSHPRLSQETVCMRINILLHKDYTQLYWYILKNLDYNYRWNWATENLHHDQMFQRRDFFPQSRLTFSVFLDSCRHGFVNPSVLIDNHN